MRCGEAAAPPGALEAGRVLNPMALGQALRQLMARSRITTTRALVAASDALASFRILTFPKSATEAEIEAAVRSQLNLGSDRMALRYTQVPGARDERTVFAAVWDRDQIQAIVAAIRQAGLEPGAVDLKSLCVARALTVDSCLLLDLTVEPCEVVLIDQRVPRVWHAFKVGSDGDVALTIADGLKPVVGFQKRLGGIAFGTDSPILVRSDQALPPLVTRRLEQLTGRHVDPVPQPWRADPEVRYGPYLTCLGLVMRRSA